MPRATPTPGFIDTAAPTPTRHKPNITARFGLLIRFRMDAVDSVADGIFRELGDEYHIEAVADQRTSSQCQKAEPSRGNGTGC